MSDKDKPPDYYKCIKIPLEKIVADKANRKIILSAVFRTNKIIVKTYLLLRLWVLNKYHTNAVIPKITQETIITCMQTLNLNSYSSTKKKPLYNEFRQLFLFEQEDGSNLTQILKFRSITILTMIENNIKYHFFDYLKRYVKSYFFNKFKDEIDNKNIDSDDLKKELNKVINDLINNTYDSDSKYHDWINENKYKMLPKLENDNDEINYYFDINNGPQKYLKHMIWMSLEIEKLDKKMFQFFPLQNNIIPKFIGIDTATIIDLFISENNTYYQQNVNECADELWSSVFNLKDKRLKLKIKGYSFDEMVSTDGYSVSVRFINNKYIYEKKEKTIRKQNGKLAVKGLSKEEKEIIKEKKEEEIKEKNKQKLKEKVTCICGTITTKGSFSNHKKSVKHKKYLKDNDITDESGYIEFPYITEVDKNELEGKHIFIDPGKRDLFSMIDDDGNRLTYSNKQRIKGTKRLLQQNKLQRYRDKQGITEIENVLSNYNSKSCNINNFKTFIVEKIKVNNILYEKYEKEIFRKYKMRSYINTKRCEDKMLNLIENKYGKDSKIIIGDWSQGKQMRNFISTPNIGLKRKLKERFKVYNIDEYRTSCLHYKTEEKVKNLYVKDWCKTKLLKNRNIPFTEYEKTKIEKSNRLRKLHSVLIFKLENGRMGCINRDYNGCLNIRKIFNEYLSTGTRPEKYCRGYKEQQNGVTSN
jgi:hypothetical protein